MSGMGGLGYSCASCAWIRAALARSAVKLAAWKLGVAGSGFSFFLEGVGVGARLGVGPDDPAAPGGGGEGRPGPDSTPATEGLGRSSVSDNGLLVPLGAMAEFLCGRPVEKSEQLDKIRESDDCGWLAPWHRCWYRALVTARNMYATHLYAI